jgi:hypothetical protein
VTSVRSASSASSVVAAITRGSVSGVSLRRTMSVSMNEARRDKTWIPLSCSVTRSALKLRAADLVAAYAAFPGRGSVEAE